MLPFGEWSHAWNLAPPAPEDAQAGFGNAVREHVVHKSFAGLRGPCCEGLPQLPDGCCAAGWPLSKWNTEVHRLQIMSFQLEQEVQYVE